MKILYRIVHEDESQTLHSELPATPENEVPFPSKHVRLGWEGDTLTVYEEGDELPPSGEVA